MPFPVPDPANLPLVANLAAFAVAAAVIWYAGVRMARIGDVLSERTGLGQAVFGLLFLALATSLPEVTTTVTASLSGNASLATNNLLGGIVLQTVVLTIADGTLRSGALTFFSPKPVLLLQGTLLIALLGLTLSVIIAREPIAVASVGVGSVFLLLAYLGSLYLLRTYDPSERWQPVERPELPTSDDDDARGGGGYDELGTAALFTRFAIAVAAILIAGVALATVADAVARQTGIGSSFIGATLLAASTSLPEVSTTVAAVRIGAYSMAISNIFGSNALMVGLIFVADLSFTGGPILREVDRSAVFAAAAGVVATTIYLAGLVERRNWRVWALGLDSVAILVVYGVSLVVLWTLQ